MITLLGSLLIASRPDSAVAGFLDFLLDPQPAQAPSSTTSDPLEMTVRPRKSKPHRRLGEPRTAVSTPIDTVANPSWHLDDPTLRFGDIVVLPRGAMIYRGKAAERRLSDFERLSRTTLLSRSERERIRRMTDYKRDSEDGRVLPADRKALPNTAKFAPAETVQQPSVSAQNVGGSGREPGR